MNRPDGSITTSALPVLMSMPGSASMGRLDATHRASGSPDGPIVTFRAGAACSAYATTGAVMNRAVAAAAVATWILRRRRAPVMTAPTVAGAIRAPASARNRSKAALMSRSSMCWVSVSGTVDPRPVVAEVGGECGAPPVQQDPHGGQGDALLGGDLGDRQVGQVVQDDRAAVLGGQLGQGGDQGHPVRV